jgi:hypothetical protein
MAFRLRRERRTSNLDGRLCKPDERMEYRGTRWSRDQKLSQSHLNFRNGALAAPGRSVALDAKEKSISELQRQWILPEILTISSTNTWKYSEIAAKRSHLSPLHTPILQSQLSPAEFELIRKEYPNDRDHNILAHGRPQAIHAISGTKTWAISDCKSLLNKSINPA